MSGLTNRLHTTFRCSLLWLLVSLVLGKAPDIIAQSRQFSLPTGEMTLVSDEDGVEVFFRNLRRNRVTNEWRLEMTVRNRSGRPIVGPIMVSLDAASPLIDVRSPDGVDSAGDPFFSFDERMDDGELAVGETSSPRTVRLRFVESIPELGATVFRTAAQRDYRLAVAQSLDGDGQILPRVKITEISDGAAFDSSFTDDRFGWVTLGGEPGRHWWRFEKADYMPVWRGGGLVEGQVSILPSPKLVREVTDGFRLSPLNGAEFISSDESISVSFPAGSFSQLGEGRITPLSSQNLPATLPLGWSPLQAFWLAMDAETGRIGMASLVPWGSIGSEESAVLVRWRASALAWEVEAIEMGAGTGAVDFSLRDAGAYAVVVADQAGATPLAPEVGEPLRAAVGLFADLASITADGQVTPTVAAASTDPRLVTADAVVTFQHPTADLVSGTSFSCVIQEHYQLQDGTIRRTPVYECSLVAYQRPGDASSQTLQVTFPLRPQLLLGPDELTEATITVDVRLPEGFDGDVIGPDGDDLRLPNGLQLLIAPGIFTTSQAIRARSLDVSSLQPLVPDTYQVVAGFELTLGQTEENARLSLFAAEASPSERWVLGRVVSRAGVYGVEPVERLGSEEDGRLVSLEPNEDRLTGIDRSGQYLLMRLPEPQAYVRGVAANAEGEVADGLLVRLAPWITYTEGGGRYRLLAPLGDTALQVLDARTGDTAITSLSIEDSGALVAANVQTVMQGPVVVSVDPSDGAERVPTISAVTVGFSKSVNPATVLGGGISLIDQGGVEVPVSLSLNTRNTTATLFPVNPLLPEMNYRIQLAQSVVDAQGLPLEGTTEFRFATAAPPNRGAGGQLIVYQPGAQNLPEEVANNLVGYDPETNPFVVAVHGTQGTADPEVPVVVTNESTGETATVLSKVDGSFYTFIDGTEDDFVSATYVNLNGTRVYLPVSRQEFDNGFVGLYQQGGILEAESDGGPVQVLVEPGAIDDKSKLRLQPVDLVKLLNLLKGVQPEGGGQVLGGMVLSVDGDETPSTRAELSFEVNRESLPLDPGIEPEDATWGLAIPREYDGVTAYEIIDSMEYVDGKLVTQGMMADRGSDDTAVPALQRLRNATVTPGGIVSEQLRPPISIGVLFEAISAAQKGSKRVNALDLSSDVLQSLGLPGIGEVLRHQLLLPIMMAQGTSVGVGGVVKAIRVDDSGVVDQDDSGDKLVGAVVMVDQGPLTRRPGKLRPGIMYASSNQKGEYSFNVPITLEATDFIVTATHPRYPFQVANGGATVRSLADRFGLGNFANVPLFFAKGDFYDAGPAGDTIKPVIRAAHDPTLPAPGTTDESEGVVLTVVGIDNGSMSNVDAVVRKVINLSTGAEEMLDTIEIEEIGTSGAAAANSSPGNSLTKRFRLKSPRRSRVTMELSAVDSAGQSTEVPYLLTFGGERPQLTPQNPNDNQGPRVLFAWPPEGAGAVQPGKPILLRFSESLAEASFGTVVSSWLAFESHQIISAQPSKDFKEVAVHYSGPASGEVKLSISSTLVDRNGKSFDQDPDQTGEQAYSLSFNLAGAANADLPQAPVSGGGVVFHGAHAFAIEREGSEDGAIFAYDLSEPSSPSRVGVLSVPGYPSALAMLPDYSMQLGPSADCGTADYLAVAGGRNGFQGPPKYLWIANVNDPTSMHRVSGAVITFSDTARINGMQWSPPFLGILIADGGITSIQVINVPEMVYGLSASLEEAEAFPTSGGNGIDMNRDGDYCDADEGDLPPIPSNKPDQLFGNVVTLAPPSPNERILDFAIDADSGVIGTVYYVAGESGGSGYRTLFAGLEPVDGATVSFDPTDYPKRLLFLPGTPVSEEVNGEPVINFKNLALVSISGATPRLALLDLTAPREPSLIHYLDLPSDSGIPQSMQVRGDGFVVVATPSRYLLLDPSQLLKTDTSGDGHPAFVGRLASIGSNSKQYVADTSGVNVTSSGGHSRVSITSPQIQLLSFPEDAGSVDDIIAMSGEERTKLLLQGRESEFLVPVKLASPAQSTNITAATSYYVFVNAPGGFGSEIPMSLVSLNRSGKMLPQARNSEMPRFLTDETTYDSLTISSNNMMTAMSSAGMGGGMGANSSFSTDFVVKRLGSGTGNSVFYNTYLGGPLVLTRRDIKTNEISTLNTDVMGRRFLRAGDYLWAGLAPQGYSGSTAITNFTSRVDGMKLLPGASSLYRVARPRLPLILIHGVAGSHLEINEDAEDTSIINQLRAKVFSELWPGYHVFNNALTALKVPILSDIAEYVSYVRLLELENGEPASEMESQVVASDIIRQLPEAYNGFSGSGLNLVGIDALEKVYAPLIDYITQDLGYVEFRHMKLDSDGKLVTGMDGFRANEMYQLRMAPDDDSEGDDDADDNADDMGDDSGNSRQKFDDFIKSQVPNNPDFFIFVYDWRLSNATTAKKLEEYLEVVKVFHPDLEKIDIVAHSMGGLVARRFIMNNPEKVSKLITLGTPFLGATKAILTMETGQFLDSGIQHAIIISKKSMRDLAKFFAGPHQLIPAAEYFGLVSDTFVEQGWDYNRNMNAYDTLSFDDFKTAFDTIRFANVNSTPVQETADFNDNSVTPPAMDGQMSSPIHQTDWTNDPTDVEYYHIYGVQAAPRTVGKVRATRRIRPSLVDTGYFTFREELEVQYVLGDGTVPLVSAARMATGGEMGGTGGGLNAPSAVRIPLVATEDTSAANKLVDHNGMNGNPELHRLVGAILNEEFQQPAATSSTASVVNTIRIANADRSSIKVMDENGDELPARVMANLSVPAEEAMDGNAMQPAADVSLRREGIDDNYGVQIYEVDPFAVAGANGMTPNRDDEGDDKADMVEIVTYGETFKIELEQSETPVSVRIEQERDGVIERLLIWNDLDGEDLPDDGASTIQFGRRRALVPLASHDDEHTIIINSPVNMSELPTVEMEAMSDEDDDPTQEDGGATEILADVVLEGEPARDTTAESSILCEGIAHNSKYRFFLEGADGAAAQFGRFYYCEEDPGLSADPLKMTKMSGGSILDVRDLIGTISGNAVWVVGEDAAKNVASAPPTKVPLIYVGWTGEGLSADAQPLVSAEENDWRGFLPYDPPDVEGIIDDLLGLEIVVEPADLAEGSVRLELEQGDGRVRVLDNINKDADAELTLPMVWELGSDNIPEVLYVEATDYSNGSNDVVLKLTYENPDAEIEFGGKIQSRIRLTIPEIIFEPINGELGVSANSSGVVVGQETLYVMEVLPQGIIPDEFITWNSAQNRVAFDSPTGAEVMATGFEEGEDELIANIEGFLGAPPSININVFPQVETAKVFAFILADDAQGNGRVYEPADIPARLSEINEYYEHIGIAFEMEGEARFIVPPTAGAWNDLNDRNLRDAVRSIDFNTEGIEMYFVNMINGTSTTGINLNAQNRTGGLLVATAQGVQVGTIAHELGHSCLLKDIYPSTSGSSIQGPPSIERVPRDWGASTGEHSYYAHNTEQVDLIERLLMMGFRSEDKRDIPMGTIHGFDTNDSERLIFVGQTPPPGTIGPDGAPVDRILRTPAHW